MKLTQYDRTIILKFLSELIEMSFKNQVKHASAAKVLQDKTVAASASYWKNVTSGYKHAYFLAGGDKDSVDSILSRVKMDAENEVQSV